MSRRDAERLIRERGGRVAGSIGGDVDLVVVSDDIVDPSQVATDRTLFDDAACSAWQAGTLELVRESELWARLGLIDAEPGVERLYTPAMLAELLGVPIAAIRTWHRKGGTACQPRGAAAGVLRFRRGSHRPQARRPVGCRLLAVGDQSQVGRARAAAARGAPTAGRRGGGRRGELPVRARGGGLTEPSGQLLLDFDAPQAGTDTAARRCRQWPFRLPRPRPIARPSGVCGRAPQPLPIEELRSLAAELEEDGRRDQAIEAYRAILVSGEFTAEDNFFLAELLYREGELAAARGATT